MSIDFPFLSRIVFRLSDYRVCLDDFIYDARTEVLEYKVLEYQFFYATERERGRDRKMIYSWLDRRSFGGNFMCCFRSFSFSLFFFNFDKTGSNIDILTAEILLFGKHHRIRAFSVLFYAIVIRDTLGRKLPDVVETDAYERLGADIESSNINLL